MQVLRTKSGKPLRVLRIEHSFKLVKPIFAPSEPPDSSVSSVDSDPYKLLEIMAGETESEDESDANAFQSEEVLSTLPQTTLRPKFYHLRRCLFIWSLPTGIFICSWLYFMEIVWLFYIHVLNVVDLTYREGQGKLHQVCMILLCIMNVCVGIATQFAARLKDANLLTVAICLHTPFIVVQCMACIYPTVELLTHRPHTTRDQDRNEKIMLFFFVGSLCISLYCVLALSSFKWRLINAPQTLGDFSTDRNLLGVE